MKKKERNWWRKEGEDLGALEFSDTYWIKRNIPLFMEAVPVP